MDEFPAHALTAGPVFALESAVAGEAMAKAVDHAEPLDANADQFAAMLAFEVPEQLGQFQRLQPILSQSIP